MITVAAQVIVAPHPRLPPRAQPQIPSGMLCLVAGAFLLVPFVIILSKLLKYHLRNLKSPLRKIPGPQSQNWLFGNIKEIFERGQTVAWDEWMSTFGKTYRYNSLFSVHFPFHCAQIGFSSPFLSRFLSSLPPTLER